MYTLPYVYQAQAFSTWADVTGSSIDYKPPPGARQVTYQFTCHMGKSGTNNHSLGHMKLFVDGTEITDFRTSPNGYYSFGRRNYYYVFEIGTTDSASDGKFSFMGYTQKTIKLQHRDHHATVHGIDFHRTEWWDGSHTQVFSAPTLRIEAIGEENLVYNLMNQ